jgi:hypothetical protein
MKFAGHCFHCRRAMTPSGSKSVVERTADHLMPAWMRYEGLDKATFANLNATVPCCWHCNQLKGHKSPGQWEQFMRENPRWWEMPQHRRTHQTRKRRKTKRRSSPAADLNNK